VATERFKLEPAWKELNREGTNFWEAGMK
jgi:hypothetical protein